MSYIRKNVNFFLLFMVIALVISIVALTAYYQKTYEKLADGYDAKLEEIGKLVTNLNQSRAKLNETSYELTIKKEREGELAEQYVGVKSTLEEKEEELDSTKANLDSTKASLAQTQVKLTSAEQQVTSLTAVVGQQKSEINSCKATLSDCQDARDDYKAERNAACSACGTWTGTKPSQCP